MSPNLFNGKTDIVVIGAGPAGLITAREVARRGFDVCILEEHGEVGVPCHCAGLFSLQGLKDLQVPVNENFIQNMVLGARFFSPSGSSFTVEKDLPVACVVNRIQFDKFLAKQAINFGADLRLNSKVRNIKQHNEKMILTGNFGEIKADIVVDAEGINSHIIKEMGFKPLPFKRLLPALQYDLKGVNIDSKYVEVHIGRKFAPSFFTWVIPLNENTIRAGLACKGYNPSEKLERFISQRFIGEKTTRVNSRSGLIVTSGFISKTFQKNFIAVGDVAGQVKPITGGGVIFGGTCAMIAGKVIAEALENGDFTEKKLGNYQYLWRQKFAKEIKLSLLFRKVLDRLSDKTCDKIFKIIIESNFHKKLSLEGNMDFQAKTILNNINKKDMLKILLLFASDLIGV